MAIVLRRVTPLFVNCGAVIIKCLINGEPLTLDFSRTRKLAEKLLRREFQKRTQPWLSSGSSSVVFSVVLLK